MSDIDFSPRRRRGSSIFGPWQLFTAGEVGFVFDPSIMSSLWQDSTRTTPVTAVGDPIGAWDDISVNGFNALQSVSGSRPTWGRRPRTGVRNQFTYTEDLTNAAWAKNAATVTAVNSPNGDLTAFKLVPSAALDTHSSFQNSSVTSGQSYTLSFEASSSGYDYVNIYNSTGFSSLSVNFDLSNGTVNSASGATATIAAGTGGMYLCTVTATASSTSATGRLIVRSVPSPQGSGSTYSGDGASGAVIWHPQFEQSATATNYQRVTGAWDVTESGVESIPLVWFDGIADHLVMTATAADIARNRDHFAVVAGIQRASTAANNPVFFASTATAANARVILGTASGNANFGGRRLDADSSVLVTNAQAINTSAVVSGIADYQNTTIRLRQNGAQTAINAAFQTAGSTENAASAAVFIGRQDASYFSGSIFGIVGLSSRQMTTAELLNTERWTAIKSGVTL